MKKKSAPQMSASNAPPEAVPEEILKRKGARTTAAVPDEVRRLLNAGVIEAANLSEWLIVDHTQLAHAVLPRFGWEHLVGEVEQRLSSLKSPTAMKRTLAVGSVLSSHLTSGADRQSAVKLLKSHPSDTVRTWACAMIGQMNDLSLSDKLTWLKPLAADSNMGVRELAWMAVRPCVSATPGEAVSLLQPWAEHPDFRIRRFASEVTRPRGVWCQHIQILKDQPELAVPLLDLLRSDDARYVQDSVGNWLNDASKTRPDFAISLCGEWQVKSPVAQTRYIVRRALRTLKKQNSPLLQSADRLNDWLR